ncbi:putative OTU domain, papain-like cysteine peptidase superfamily [Helianthus debilis subsp. tardiflorus]
MEPVIDWNEVPDKPARHSSYMIDLNEVPLMNHLNIMGDIPKVFHPYITNIRNVKPDGNCGFRALAVCLGLDEHEYYEYIRQQMREELQNRYHIYAGIFFRDVNSLYQDLCFFGSPCPREHWMKMPEAGVLIANKFGVIVHSLSMSGSFTIFLFWSGPEEIQHHRALTIALVNDENHYVMVELQGGYPMPTITPYWNFRNISMSAAGWETMYRWRLELYTQLDRRESGFVDLGD